MNTFNTYVKQRKGPVLGVILICGCMAILLVPTLFSVGREPCYIGVAGPMSGASAGVGDTMLKGIRLYLKKVNKEGGINGRKVKLLVMDDRNDRTLARQVAANLANRSEASVVLGHYYSSTSMVAGDEYKKARIPAITASATADDITIENDWYFRIVPNNRIQAIFTANYIYYSLERDKATIVYTEDSYGEGLKDSFKQAAQRLGLKIESEFGIDLEHGMDDRVHDIVSEIRKIDDPGMIFLATHVFEGVKVITSLRYPGTRYSVIGQDAFSNESFIRELKKYPQERALPGYYSDGVYAASPFMIDIADEKAQVFRSEYMAEYGEEPSWVSAGYYDAAQVAVAALRSIGTSESVGVARRKVREYLAGLYQYDDAVEGVTGEIYFTPRGDLIRPMAMGVYRKQKLISTLTQYHTITDLKHIDNLLKEVLNGEIIKIENRFMKKSRVVYTGIDINEISNLDVESFKFTVDFYLWFRYRASFGDLEFDDTDIEFVNAVNDIKLGKPVMEEKVGEIMTRAWRVRADFKSDFRFHDYPFDHQILSVRLRHSRLTRSSLMFISDIQGMRLLSSDQEAARKSLYISGWQVKDILFYPNVVSKNSSLGVPRLFDSLNRIQYSQYNVSINIKRDVLSFLYKNLFLLFVVVLVSYLVYFIPADQFGTRISIGMTALMTNALLHLKFSTAIPVGYMLAIDHAFFSVYTLAAVTLVISLGSYILHQIGDQSLKIRYLNVAGRVFHPIVVFLLSFLFLYIYVLKRKVIDVGTIM